MWSLHTKTEEHWVPIKTVASFKRMREYTPRGNDWLLDTLRESTLLEISEDKENVRRKTPVKEPKKPFERSIYAVSHPFFEHDST